MYQFGQRPPLRSDQAADKRGVVSVPVYDDDMRSKDGGTMRTWQRVLYPKDKSVGWIMNTVKVLPSRPEWGQQADSLRENDQKIQNCIYLYKRVTLINSCRHLRKL